MLVYMLLSTLVMLSIVLSMIDASYCVYDYAGADTGGVVAGLLPTCVPIVAYIGMVL